MEDKVFSEITAIITSVVLVTIFVVGVILYKKHKAAKKSVNDTDLKKAEE